MDWNSLFVPTMNLGEVFLRGTAVYLFLFFLLRALRRGAGNISISDLLVVVLISDASQNAMGKEYASLTEGVILVATIVFWDFVLDWLSYRSPAIARWVRPAPLPLIKNGCVQLDNMKRQLIKEDELIGKLREAGVESVAEVKSCYLEGDGRISVVRQKPVG